MNAAMPYQLLANIVLAIHFLVVTFVAGGLVMIAIGNLFRWHWVNNLWFRASHLAAIAVVAGQAWLGMDCPLTVLEAWLRSKAGVPAYAETFIEHWLGTWMYYDAPWWTFVVAYSLFGLLVAVAWWRFPPERHHSWRKNPKQKSPGRESPERESPGRENAA